MKGYDVISSEGQKIGRVQQELDGFLVVELGNVLRVRRPLPKEFAHAQDGDRAVAVTVPESVLRDAPRVHRNGAFDVDEASKHYGLSSSYRAGEVLAQERTGHELARERERESRETGPEEDGAAPLTKQPDDEIERRPERVYMPGGK